jgi:hypothetical protein
MLNKQDFTGLGYGPQYSWTQKSTIYLGFIREEVLVINHENPYPVHIHLQLIPLMFPFIIFKTNKTE